jgi:hypothetical protein
MAHNYPSSYVEIDERIYKSSRYISRCRVLDYDRSRLTVLLDSREYQEALYMEEREKMMYCNNYAYTTSQATISPPTYNSEPIKKKVEKVSKNIRHQFLRKRLLERLT